MEGAKSIPSTLVVINRMSMAGASALLLIVCATPPAPAVDFWDQVVVDSGSISSLAILPSGYPAIGYYTGSLEYAWFDGNDWHTTIVDSGGDVGWWCSLSVLPSGHPALSYYDATNKDLKYAWFDGSDWHATTVDSMGQVGWFSSLAILPSGQPAISYMDVTNRDLKYAWFDGDEWYWTTVDTAGDVGKGSSLAILPSGHPAISYYDDTRQDLKYAWHDGTQWCTTTVDGAGNVGIRSSLAILPSGYPAISYYRYVYEDGDLKYAWFDGSNWQTSTVDASGDVGGTSSIAVLPSGHPAISYHQSLPGYRLKYAYYDGHDWRMTTVDNGGSVGGWNSLAILPSGQAAISYDDLTKGDVKYAVGIAAAAPVTVTSNYTATAWTQWFGTTVVDNGPAWSGGWILSGSGFVGSFAVLETTPGGQAKGLIDLYGFDGDECVEWDEFDNCIEFEPVSCGYASGTVAGTLELGASDDYPPGSELELALEARIDGEPGDAEDYHLRLWREESLIGQIDPESSDPIVVAVQAGEMLTFELFASEDDLYGDYSNHSRGFEFRFILRAPPCSGDLDGDGDTDQADLGILLADWDCDDPVNGCAGDLDRDDDTDQADLGILLADWGCGT